jgi:hypothetical protein
VCEFRKKNNLKKQIYVLRSYVPFTLASLFPIGEITKPGLRTETKIGIFDLIFAYFFT